MKDSPHNVPDDTPWRDEELLYHLYIEKQMGMAKIAEQLGCTADTIYRWLKKFDIQTRPPTKDRPVHFHTEVDGAERWSHKNGDEQYKVLVHRLAAVAWFGLDSVRGREVHHKIPIRWLNTEWNLDCLSSSEHLDVHQPWLESSGPSPEGARERALGRERDDNGRFV